MTPTSKPAFPAVERIVTIHAPPAKVYRAWLDGETVQQWMGPGHLRVLKIEIEERVGGHYRVYQGDDEGIQGGFDGKIIEMEPNTRLVFDWAFFGGPEPTESTKVDSRLTIELSAAPGGATRLRLLHEKLDALHAAMPDVAENVGVGWEDVLAKLDRALATEGSS